MTVLEFVRAAHDLLPRDSVAVEVMVWHRRGEIDPRYSVWSSEHSRHFSGATPDECLEAIRAFLAPAPHVDGDPEELDELGELPLATSSELPARHHVRDTREAL